MTAPAELENVARLGADVARRMRLPGPVLGRVRPPRIGSIASSSVRFAQALTRPARARQWLQGPTPVRVNRLLRAPTRPPRWWLPMELTARGERVRSKRLVIGQPEQLPPRGLRRAVHRIPNEETWTPGGMLERLVGVMVPVRRLDAVTAAGPMLMSQDTAKLNAATARRTPQPAGAAPGPRPAPRAPAGTPPGPRADALQRAPVSATPDSVADAGQRPPTGVAPAAGPPGARPPAASAASQDAEQRASPPGPPSGTAPAPTADESAGTARVSRAEGAARAPASPASGGTPPGAAPVSASAVPPATPEPANVRTATPPVAAAGRAPGWSPARISRFAAVRRASIAARAATQPVMPGATRLGRTATRLPVSTPIGLGRTLTPARGAPPAGSGEYGAEPAMPSGPSAGDVRSVGARHTGALPTVHTRSRYSVSVLRRMVRGATAVNPALRLAGALPPPVVIPAGPAETQTAEVSAPRASAPRTSAPQPTSAVAGGPSHAGAVAAAGDAQTQGAGPADLPAQPVGPAAAPMTTPQLPGPQRTVVGEDAPATPRPAEPAQVRRVLDTPSGVAESAPSPASPATPTATAQARPSEPATPAAQARPAEPASATTTRVGGTTSGFGAAPGVALATLRALSGSASRQTAVNPALRVARLPVRSSATGWFLPTSPGQAAAPTHTIARMASTASVRVSTPQAAAATQAAAMTRGTATTQAAARTYAASAGPTAGIGPSATPRAAGRMSSAPNPVPAAAFSTTAPTLLAMSDLLAATRSLPQGITFEGQRALATAFGASEEIRPASGAVLSTPAASGTSRGAPNVFRSAPATAAGGGVRPGPAGPGSTGPGSTRPAASRATGRALLPAPPPISIRRAPRTAPKPPTPVRSATPSLVPGPGGILRQSLVQTTAHLFDAAAASPQVAGDPSRGVEMLPSGQSTLRVVSAAGQPPSEPEVPDVAAELLANPSQLHELVDAIVDRIERRVVDELERRGRRQNFGAF